MRRKIRINESALRSIVMESVRAILNESCCGDCIGTYDGYNDIECICQDMYENSDDFYRVCNYFYDLYEKDKDIFTVEVCGRNTYGGVADGEEIDGVEMCDEPGYGNDLENAINSCPYMTPDEKKEMLAQFNQYISQLTERDFEWDDCYDEPPTEDWRNER